MANRRKRDTAALERRLAELNLEEPSSSDTAIENIVLSAIEVKHPSPCVGVTAALIGSVTEKLKLILVCFDSGAEITVLPPELAPETPTEESEERRSGVKYFVWPRRQEQSHTRLTRAARYLKTHGPWIQEYLRQGPMSFDRHLRRFGLGK